MILQFTGSFEYLRPNMKDILYQLEINTFRDGLLAKKDHAGCGLLLVRCVRRHLWLMPLVSVCLVCTWLQVYILSCLHCIL